MAVRRVQLALSSPGQTRRSSSPRRLAARNLPSWPVVPLLSQTKESGGKREKMALKSYQLFSIPGMDSHAICVTDDDWDENDEEYIQAGYEHVERLTLTDAEELEARLHKAMLGLGA